jgi:4-hydroxy-tetrahydrodipicolinate synthase
MDVQSLRGVYPAIVTPFTADDRLDEGALGKVTDYVIEGGVHAIMSTGGTGEFPHLDREERKRATEVIVAAARGRVPIIAGTAAASTVIPKQMVDIYRLTVDGQHDAARALHMTDAERSGVRAALKELGLL